MYFFSIQSDNISVNDRFKKATLIKNPGILADSGKFRFGEKKLLLQGLLNSNGHGDGHADHGVVACVGITGNRLEIVQGAQSNSQKFVKVSRLLPHFTPSATDGKSVLVTKVVPFHLEDKG